MYCRNCGNELKDGVRFCPSCGAPVMEAAEAKNAFGEESPIFGKEDAPIAAGSEDRAGKAGAEIPAGNESPIFGKEAGSDKAGNGKVQGNMENAVKAGTVRKNDNRGLRIGLSVLLAFLAVFSFGAFFLLYTLDSFFKYDYRTELESRIDIEKVIVGKLAGIAGADVVDPEGSIAEAVRDIAEKEFDVEIEAETVEEILGNKELMNEFMQYASAFSGQLQDGNVDLDAMAQGFMDIYEKNKDILENPENHTEQPNDISGSDILENAIGVFGDPLSEITGDDGEKSEVLEGILRDRYSEYEVFKSDMIRYGLLALGLVFCGVIVFLNRNILSSGLRGCGLVGIITGVLNALSGLGLFLVSKATTLIRNLINENIPDLEDIGSAVIDVARDVLDRTSGKVLLLSAVFTAIGICLMIASGIMLGIEKKRMINN